jgi:hypothetical protein
MTAGKSNLSISAINEVLDVTGFLTPIISSISDALHSYRAFVKPARNQLLSHIDQETVLKGKPLGGHDPDEVVIFFENLQKYCDEVGIALGVGPLDFRTTSHKGDVVDLLSHLKKGVN